MADFDPRDLIAPVSLAAPTEQLNPRTFASIARAQITPWQTGIRPSWTIAGIRGALLALRNGEFSLAAQLFDSMLEDDEFPGDLQKRVNALLRSEFHLVPPDDNDRKLNRREQAAADAFPEMVPDGELFDLIASWLVLGVGVATIDWFVDGPLWIPKLRALPTEFLRYNEFERQWYYTSREGDQKVTPGDGKWVLLAAGQRPWNWGLIRGLAVLWLSKGLTYGDWQRYCQKHGLPIIKAKIPIFRDDKEKDRFIDDLSSIQSEGVVGLPTGPDGDGYDVELLEATDGSWESFQANLDRADRKIQIMLLGSNIGTEQSEATGGSRAAAETSSNGIDQDKAKADEKYVSQCLLEQFLRPFFAFNFGPTIEAPAPHWDVCPEEDARAWADAQTAFVGMLNAVRTSGYKIKNVVELGQEYGLELEEDPDAPPAAGTEEAATIAAKAKPPVAGPPKAAKGKPRPKPKGRK
jgi:phage gp29-like protein